MSTRTAQADLRLGEVERDVQGRLCQGWSPEQITDRVKQMYPHEPGERVSLETVDACLCARPRGSSESDSLPHRANPARRVYRAVAEGIGVGVGATWSRSTTARKRRWAARHWKGDLI